MTDRPIASRPTRGPLLRRLRLLLEATGAVVLVGALLFAGGYVWFAGGIVAHEARPTGRADAIVVLTGGPSRIADGLMLLHQGHGARLLITGVHRATSKDEIARLTPENAELFACCVDLDHRALNTTGNALETGQWVRRHRFRSLVVVTSDYHMPRTLAELDAVVPGVALVPYPVVSERLRANPWWSTPSTAKLLFVEYVKYVVARVRLGLEPPGPDSRIAAAAGRSG